LHYGAEHRVIGADSPEQALDVLKDLKVRGDGVDSSVQTTE
jgi:hypothetical protein